MASLMDPQGQVCTEFYVQKVENKWSRAPILGRKRLIGDTAVDDRR